MSNPSNENFVPGLGSSGSHSSNSSTTDRDDDRLCCLSARSASSAAHSSSISARISSEIGSSRAPSSIRMSTTLVNSSQPAAWYSSTLRSTFLARSSSFFSFSRFRLVFLTALRMSENIFISCSSALVAAILALCSSRNASASASESSAELIASEDRAMETCRAASTASSLPCARHSPPLARTQRRDPGVGVGGAVHSPPS